MLSSLVQTKDILKKASYLKQHSSNLLKRAQTNFDYLKRVSFYFNWN